MTVAPAIPSIPPHEDMPNRLAEESSPYLLQHAENPVDWYPWGPEALERARREGRPILLSIGYSACHWCHVMERESFEDPETARLMNGAFVNIKVDREERPDLDGIYMKAVQALTGRGGWPLTVFLTPEGAPFYGGTYYPPEPRHGMPSFRQVLNAVEAAFRDRISEVRRTAEDLVGMISRSVEAPPDGPDDPRSILARAHRRLSDRYDAAHGGFGGAPKFPQPLVLEVLLRLGADARDGERAEAALGMATHTLRQMARGGLRDHLAGGFHRYSVDARWLVPHFEKMLYDNALLARSYLRAWQLTGDADLREVAEETLDYVLADLRSPEGGFYSARDADSEGEEGRYYVWTPEEIQALLPAEEARLFCRCYDVSESGNFEGRNILHLPHDLDAVARSRELAPEELRARLASHRATLLEARASRVPPLRDEKVLAGWNGMVLRALAEAGGALGRADYMDAARDGLDFLLGSLREDGRLLHTWKDGRAAVNGFLEDHGALGNALLSCWEATLEPRWLDEARWACEAALERFWHAEEGVFYDTPADGETLVVRPREVMDNATPSGTALVTELLLRAGHLFGEEGWTEVAHRVLHRELGVMERYPSAFGRLLSVLHRSDTPPVEVAVVGRLQAPGTRELLGAALAPFHANRTVAGREPGRALAHDLPVLRDRDAPQETPTAWVCRNFACHRPTSDPGEVRAHLAGDAP